MSTTDEIAFDEADLPGEEFTEDICGYVIYAGSRFEQEDVCDEDAAACDKHRGWQNQDEIEYEPESERYLMATVEHSAHDPRLMPVEGCPKCSAGLARLWDALMAQDQPDQIVQEGR